jgi:signal transduction histidine kinase
MKQATPIGKVILAGAGCGDPELVTVKAARCLQQAEVVLTDRLVSDAILKEYVPASAEIIYVGKQCRRGVSTPQATINELMVDGRSGLQLVFLDRGPGIPDIEQAMTDGFTTAKSMGLGLGGARRLVNEFTIESRPGEGTKVSVTQWKRR